MEKIIVVGYPKSGNTWITRLTGSLVDCPVEGFLYGNHKEIASEGKNRESEYRIYKSHHQFFELSKEDIKSSKIIYVIRDPRDVAISGRHFFSFFKPIFPNINISSKKEPFVKMTSFIKHKINGIQWRLTNKSLARNIMNKAILYGNKDVHHWCRISWKTHISLYINNPDILKIQYESLLSNPLPESKRILNFIGIKKDEEKILKAIDNQSFEIKKENYLKEKNISKANFLRKGKKNQWKSILSKKENHLFVSNLKNELINLGYDLEK